MFWPSGAEGGVDVYDARITSLEGYLYKLKRKPQNMLLPQWNKRFFTIEGRVMRWYKSKQTLQPSGEVQLATMTLDRFDSSLPQASHAASAPIAQLAQSFSFTIGTPTRSLLLRAESQVEMEKWIRVLSINADRARGGDGHGRLPGGGDSRDPEPTAPLGNSSSGTSLVGSGKGGGAAPGGGKSKYRVVDDGEGHGGRQISTSSGNRKPASKGGPLSAAMERIEEQLRLLQALEGDGGDPVEANVFASLANQRFGGAHTSTSTSTISTGRSNSSRSSSSSSTPKKQPPGSSPYRSPHRATSSSSGSSSHARGGDPSTSSTAGAGRGVRLAGGLVYMGDADSLSLDSPLYQRGSTGAASNISSLSGRDDRAREAEGGAPMGLAAARSAASGTASSTGTSTLTRFGGNPDFPSFSDISTGAATLSDIELGVGQVVRGERGKPAWSGGGEYGEERGRGK